MFLHGKKIMAVSVHTGTYFEESVRLVWLVRFFLRWYKAYVYEIHFINNDLLLKLRPDRWYNIHVQHPSVWSYTVLWNGSQSLWLSRLLWLGFLYLPWVHWTFFYSFHIIILYWSLFLLEELVFHLLVVMRQKSNVCII